MPVFVAQESKSGNAMLFGFTRSGVEIVADVGGRQMHGNKCILAGALTNEEQIDGAVMKLIQELQAAAATAKQLLKKQQSTG
jgi:hypothetical protein